ncbi:hypothetical protein [Rubritalea sp.]|uniref:hypothetical protein n=1 Tax=Rubritalea sp. TaxID=2109375 RepID=UPI003EF86040
MRYLTLSFIKSALNRGKAVDQFLGEITRDGLTGVRYIQISVEDGEYQLTTYDKENIGSEDFLDIYSFPSLIEDEEYDRPYTSYSDLEAALSASTTNHGTQPDRWVNEGVVQDEYKDYLTQN